MALLPDGIVSETTKGCEESLKEVGTMDPQEEKALKVLESASDNTLLSSLSDLVKEGISLNKQDSNGWTPLHHASDKGNVNNVEMLLENGADPTVCNNEGQTAIHLAAKQPQSDVMMVFLDRSIAVEQRDHQGCTALHLACSSGSPATVRCLLQRGAYAEVRNKNGQTPLHIVIEQENLEALKLLLRAKVDLDTKDNRGQTALHHAVFSRLRVVVHYLLGKGAYVDAKDGNGNTPLHVATKNAGNHSSPINFAGLLLAFGASIGVRNQEGQTAYQLTRGSLSSCDVPVEYYKQFLKMQVLRFPADEELNKIHLCKVRQTENKKLYDQEVKAMKMTEVAEGFTLYDLVADCDKPIFDQPLLIQLRTFLYADGFLRQFPKYGYILRTKLKRAMRSKFYLTHQALKTVVSPAPREKWCFVPPEIWLYIFSFLRKDDIIAFTISGED